jgi:orotidine-5'-phosphate decarboxylase
MGLRTKLEQAWSSSQSMLCVGLDPDPELMPPQFVGSREGTFEFCKSIVDATAEYVCAFKPQFAYFAAQAAETQLEHLCRYIRDVAPEAVLILDAKRGDIGPTAVQYAKEAFVRYGADAVTVNPYLGTDSLTPYLRYDGHGIFALCRTSNPGGGDFQSLDTGGEPLYCRVARRAAHEWSALGECGLVVGATYPAELRNVRSIAGELPVLVPGVGAQGGDIAATVDAGCTSNGFGLVINSSRAILYASNGPDFATAAARQAQSTRDEIRGCSARRGVDQQASASTEMIPGATRS